MMSEETRMERFAAKAGEETRNLTGVGPYDKDAIKHLVSMLDDLSKALGLLHTVQGELTDIKGHQISPDGKLGGKGYILSIRKIKDLVSESVNNISDLTDTFSDELTNPRWQLTEEEIKEFIGGRDRLVAEFEQMADTGSESAPEIGAPEAPAETPTEAPAEPAAAPVEEAGQPAPEVAEPVVDLPFKKLAGISDQELVARAVKARLVQEN